MFVNALQYLGNNVIASAYEHARTDADIFTQDIIIIVERRFADRNAHEVYGLKMRKGSEFSGSSDFPGDIRDRCREFLCGEFIGDLSSREFIGKAHLIEEADIVEFDYHAVNQKIELTAALRHLFDFGNDFLHRAEESVVAHRQPVFTHEVIHFPPRRKGFPFDIADIVADAVETAGGCDLGIEVADRTGSRITGVLKLLVSRFVELFEHRKAHIAFAPDFEFSLIRNGFRNVPDRHRLCKDAFADNTVASRCCLNKLSAVVSQIDSQTVELILKHEFDPAVRTAGPVFIAACFPFTELINALDLVKAPKPVEMGVREKARRNFAADAMGGGVRQNNSGLLLKAFQLIEKRVEFSIAYGRLVREIISP